MSVTPPARPFSFAPVEAKLTEPHEDVVGSKEMAARLNRMISEATIRRMRLRGLSYDEADKLANKGLGIHPCFIWGQQWWDDAFESFVSGAE